VVSLQLYVSKTRHFSKRNTLINGKIFSDPLQFLIFSLTVTRLFKKKKKLFVNTHIFVDIFMTMILKHAKTTSEDWNHLTVPHKASEDWIHLGIPHKASEDWNYLADPYKAFEVWNHFAAPHQTSEDWKHLAVPHKASAIGTILQNHTRYLHYVTILQHLKYGTN